MTERIPKANFHTHTTYCDGKETAESMVQAALEKGFSALGFSGHSYTAYDESYCMSREDVQKYIADVYALREKYAGQIEIFCGIEQDFGSNEPTDVFDYVIGSVHAVERDGLYYSVDESPEVFARGVREGFGGDVYAYVKAFYELESQVVGKTNADFIGHFDLVTKFNEENRFFDPEDRRYRDASLSALGTLLETGKPFEINTGAIYRGMRKTPYPSVSLLKEIYRCKGEILLSSDSHDGASLGFGFAEAAGLAREIGFRCVKVWTKNGFVDFPL